MYDSRGLFCWQQTSTIESLIINMNRDTKKTKAVHPDQLNPFIDAKKSKNANKITGKAAWELFKQIVINTMAQQKKRDN